MSNSFESLTLLIKQAQYRQHQALEARLAPLDISLVQWNALREIDRNPGCSLRKLAQLTFNSDQAFGSLVARLLGLGLVVRRPGIGRATVHGLTEKGAEQLAQGQQCLGNVFAELLAPLDEAEQALLRVLLTKLLAGEMGRER